MFVEISHHYQYVPVWNYKNVLGTYLPSYLSDPVAQSVC